MRIANKTPMDYMNQAHPDDILSKTQIDAIKEGMRRAAELCRERAETFPDMDSRLTLLHSMADQIMNAGDKITL